MPPTLDNSSDPQPTFSVGSTTSEPSLTDQVKRFKPRKFKEKRETLLSKDPSQNNPSHEKLSLKCIKVIVSNFDKNPSHSGIPASHVREITSRLPINLDPKKSAVYVHDESYWKRACLQSLSPSECQIVEHGLTWKQLFFENHLQKRLEGFKDGDDIEVLLEEIEKFQDYIFCLRFRQMPGHIDLDRLTASLPNLTKIDLQYNINKIGMDFDRRLFGMKISDASCLAKSVKDSENLTSIVLSGNLMDDDLLRMLMTGLYKSSTITHLDVSHNKITNHGVRLLAKLLGTKSVLTSLNVADNQIHAEGGRYLGRALRSNDSLSDLNMRLNRLTDEGGRMLLEGLRDNQSVTRLNVSGNSLGSESTSALSVVLREQDSELMILDLSSNRLSDADVQVLSATMERNDRLISMDMRMNSTTDGNEDLEKIQEKLHYNELNLRS
ncbi:hypothetical protein TL16_g02262 [Triparma laevis f. inornata]|uniref:T-complex-associated testis-expressed protein 1 n=2 Tax=Triparma laevis TaxID=1534972 RepID=A0A9W7FPW2_9STRA|nr:hypothetical protein TL16_g02262 [Triparma laevis f. inornata]GMI16732.1 hypothetical protein TrLO_g3780 [Triparma laevis f. longispina]